MPVNKKQHYVPQFYLRGFSFNGSSISMYNLTGKNFIENASIRNQCCEDYFYGDSGLEGLLSQIEASAARVLKEIRDVGSKSIDVSGDPVILPVFVAIMMKRTLASKHMSRQIVEGVRQQLDGEPLSTELAAQINAVDEIHPEDAVREAIKLAPLISDLSHVLIDAPDDHYFITCDDPVVKVNPFLQGMKLPGSATGLYCRGLIMYLPLSPKRSLMFYDGDVYRIGSARCASRVLCTASDVKVLNDIVVQNAHENLYSGSLMHFYRSVTERNVSRLSKAVVSTETLLIPNQNVEPGNALRIVQVDVRMKSSVSIIRVRKDAKRERSNRLRQNGYLWLRDEERYRR